MKKVIALAAIGAVVLTASAVAGVKALGGTITADGSSTVGPYTTAAAEGFQAKNRGVRVTVGISGTGGGFERFCRNEIDLSDASRPRGPRRSSAATTVWSGSPSRSRTTASRSS